MTIIDKAWIYLYHNSLRWWDFFITKKIKIKILSGKIVNLSAWELAKSIVTRLGLQCQTPLRSYPLTLDTWPLSLSLIPYLLSLIPNPCSLTLSTVPLKKFRWGLLWLWLLSEVKVKSTPSLRPKPWSLTTNNFLDKGGTFLPLPPWERGLISISPSTNVAWTYVSGRHVARAYYSKLSLWAIFQTSSSFNSWKN